jgi:catechol 2,3-dioxygenase-like lactoylglutathione lyase family enzyme
MLDHVALNVSDLETSKRFFEQALQPLGYRILFEVEGFVGMGAERLDFAFAQRGPEGVAHVAFASPDRATVDACYEASLAAGGRDNGAPGIRAHYDENYYAAFVLDPDGHNIEVVCTKPEAA